MRPLQLILVTSDRAKWSAAIMLVAAHAAHGAPARLHFDVAAVAALADAELSDPIADARALGVVVTACPTGLADRAVEPSRFSDIETLGLVALMGVLEDAVRLIVL